MTSRPAGGYGADLARSRSGDLFIAYQAPDLRTIRVLRNGFIDATMSNTETLWPRIDLVNGEWAVVYQENGYLAFWTPHVFHVYRDLGEAGGPEPCVIRARPDGTCDVGWLRANPRQLIRLHMTAKGTIMSSAEILTDTTQGIDHIDDQGELVLIDDLLHYRDPLAQQYRALSRPWQSGALVVGEAAHGPERCLAYLTGQPAGVVFQGRSFRPRAVPIRFGGWTVLSLGHQTVQWTDVPPFLLDQPVTVPAIHRPLWIAWFAFADPSSRPPPGNALVAVRGDAWMARLPTIETDETAGMATGPVIGHWLDARLTGDPGAGQFLWLLEARTREIGAVTPVAYWDGRDWPTRPNLRADSWLAVQAYARASEAPDAFEAVMRGVLDRVVPWGYPVALVCQCFTSNATLTADLAGLVSVYARLARDYQAIVALLPFHDAGRASGLGDQPAQVRDLWAALAATVTTPVIVTPPPVPIPPDPEPPPVPPAPPEESDVYLPNDDQAVAAMRRIGQLYQRMRPAPEHGVMTAPAGDPDAIESGVAGVMLDVRAVAVWYGSRYAEYFNRGRGDQDLAVRWMEYDIQTSHEWVSKGLPVPAEPPPNFP